MQNQGGTTFHLTTEPTRSPAVTTTRLFAVPPDAAPADTSVLARSSTHLPRSSRLTSAACDHTSASPADSPMFLSPEPVSARRAVPTIPVDRRPSPAGLPRRVITAQRSASLVLPTT